jgi:hypothetical protein
MKTQEWLIVDKAGQSAWFSATPVVTTRHDRELFAWSRGPIKRPVAFLSQAAPYALFGLLGCANPEHQLLWSTGGSGDETSAPASQDGLPESPDPSGLPAGGQGGSACAGPDCAGVSGQPSCETSLDCQPTFVCSDGVCVGCDTIPHTCESQQCPVGWTAVPVLERGCAVCGCRPPKGCSSDTECPLGEVCYAGVACDQECLTSGALSLGALPPGVLDAQCCYGNLCAMPGCPRPPGFRLDCMVVGCSRLQDSCQSSCTNPVCTCDRRRGWLCDPTCLPGSSRCVPL